MATLQAGQTYADFTAKFIREGLWGYMGGVVQTSIAKLQAEGFTRDEALFYLEELTIVQLYRMNFPLPPVSISVYVPEPKVYTEYEIREAAAKGETLPGMPKVYTEREIMDMLARGETIQQEEYTGFEGRY